MKAESAAASAEEKASLLEGKQSHVSESIEREKKRLQNELTQLKEESKSSISRISADVSKHKLWLKCNFSFMDIVYI